jgi:hypothetical protein
MAVAKIFWGALLALLVFAGIMFALFVLGVIGVGAAVQEAQRQAVVDQRAQMQEYQQAQERARAADLARRTLGPEHRCADGVVVRVSGATFSQVGSFGRPVRCTGNLADRPLR